jgi:hypothetical protein
MFFYCENLQKVGNQGLQTQGAQTGLRGVLSTLEDESLSIWQVSDMYLEGI